MLFYFGEGAGVVGGVADVDVVCDFSRARLLIEDDTGGAR